MSFQNIYSKNNLINLLIILIPISYIAGNLLLNLNVLALIFCVFFFFKFNIFKDKLSKIDKLIIILFLYIIVNGGLNNLFNFNFPNAPNQNIVLLKSILFSRFLILFFVLKFLIKKNIINYKLLFFSFGLIGLFVSIDIIIQYVFGKDLFGLESSGRRLSGPFGDEYIAGSFIQRFFIFLVFSLLLFLKIEKKLFIQLAFILIMAISVISIFVSGNRVPLTLFILSVGLIFFYEKSFRKILFILLLIFTTIFYYMINSNKNYHSHYVGFVIKTYQITDYIKTRFLTGESKNLNTYIKEFESGITTWQENKYFGGGVKSFYYNCMSMDNSKMKNFRVLRGKINPKGNINCNSHPHNYYLQILAELGLLGLFLFILVFSVILIEAIKKTHSKRGFNLQQKILIPFLIIFITEIFPLKTTGNFFTTTNATFLFIILSFVVGLIEFKKSK